MIAATPASSKRLAISRADSSDVLAHPSIATLPSRASSPTATRPGCARAASLTSAGSRTAAVPMMTRVLPFRARHRSWRGRGCRRRVAPECFTASRICLDRRRIDRLAGESTVEINDVEIFKSLLLEQRAPEPPDRARTPCSRVMSPCSKRTHWPSFRSMAGKRSRLPLQKIRDQRQAEFLALLGVKLRADDIVAADDRGHGAAIVGFRHEIGALRRT